MQTRGKSQRLLGHQPAKVYMPTNALSGGSPFLIRNLAKRLGRGFEYFARGLAAFDAFAFGLVTLPAHFFLDAGQSAELASVIVAMAGAVYVGLVLQSGTIRHIAIQLLVASFFVATALAGLWWRRWIIPAGYAAHGLWDAIHHFRGERLAAVPRWYPPLCASKFAEK
jgi:hypothetical protein